MYLRKKGWVVISQVKLCNTGVGSRSVGKTSVSAEEIVFENG